jgi:hypothetical protein
VSGLRFEPRSSVSEVLQTALGLIQGWCNMTNLLVNSSKVAVIPITNTRALKDVKDPTVFGKTI